MSRTLCNQNVWKSTSSAPHYRIHHSPPFGSVLSRMNSVHMLRARFFEVLKGQVACLPV